MDIGQELQHPNHHAYLILGSLPLDIKTKVQKGVYVFEYEKNIGIDDIRELRDYAVQSVVEKQRIVVCIAPGITLQAQNALLKVLEELQEHVHFFLFLPKVTSILITLRSRCVVVEKEEQNTYSEEFSLFISQSIAKRIEILEKIWALEDGKRHTKIIEIIEDSERYLHECIQNNKDQKQIIQGKKIVEQTREGIQKGAFHKTTLQLLAFL